MSELPSGWADCLLEDLLGQLEDGKILQQGWSPQCDSIPAAEGEWGVLKTTAVQDGYFLEAENKKLPSKLTPKTEIEVKAGDLLMTCAGPRSRCGVICHVEKTREKLIFSGKIYRFRPNQQYVAPKFLTYLLRTSELKEKIDGIKTGISENGMNMTRDRFFSLQVRLAPLEEQLRITKKLNELLAQVDTLKAHIDAIPTLLKRFRQSVLAAAASGQLTEEWRDTNVSGESSRSEEVAKYKSVEVQEPWSHTIEAPVSWTLHVFKDVINLIGGSQPPKSEFVYETAPGLVRLIQIRDYKSDSHKVFIKQEATKKFCSADDVMIGRYGPPIFQILRGLEGAYNVALMKASPLSGVLQNEYMYRYLQNYKILNFVEAGSDRTAGQSGVNKAFLEKYPIFLPPLIEQTEIVHRVEQLFAFADQLEAKVASAKTRIDHLTQSILAKAFRGELVPQDPNDEPASVLLERIKAQRAAAPKVKRGRKASV